MKRIVILVPDELEQEVMEHIDEMWEGEVKVEASEETPNPEMRKDAEE